MNAAVISFAEKSQERLNAMQEEVMQTQLKYQRELERLERENKELRKQMLLRGNQKMSNKKIKVIESYRAYKFSIFTSSRQDQIVLSRNL